MLFFILLYWLLLYIYRQGGDECYDPELQNRKAERSGNLVAGTVYASEYIHPGLTWIL
jgi:hypothetical protein